MPRDIALRLEKAETFWTTARALQRRDPDSAISRAYYAVYHSCVALLLARVLQRETDESIRARNHREILTLTGREFGLQMDQMRVRRGYGSTFTESLWRIAAARSDADYGLDRNSELMARTEIQFARRVVTAVKEILSSIEP